MQIPNAYPQFIDTPVLLAVVGRERGKLYFAQNGIIELITAENELSPNYSDREGFFMRRGEGVLYGGGAPYDGNNESARNRFIEKVVDDLRATTKATHVRQVYLFEPKYLKGAITKALKEKTDRVRVLLVSYGNFVSDHPRKLLERIAHLDDPRYKPGDPESVAQGANAEEKRKILQKTRLFKG